MPRYTHTPHHPSATNQREPTVIVRNPEESAADLSPLAMTPKRMATALALWVTLCLGAGVGAGFAACGGPNRQDPEPAGCKGDKCEAGKPSPTTAAPVQFAAPSDAPATTSGSDTDTSGGHGLPHVSPAPVNATPTL